MHWGKIGMKDKQNRGDWVLKAEHSSILCHPNGLIICYYDN